ERKLMETVALNLAHRWYLGYRLNEPLPDHSSLTRIRERLGLPLFQRFFEQVVALCQAAGLVWGTELFFDATKGQANAALGSLRSHWAVASRAYLDDLFAGDTAGTPPWDLPESGKEAAAVATVAAPTTAPVEDTTVAPDAPRRLPFAGTPEAEQQLA